MLAKFSKETHMLLLRHDGARSHWSPRAERIKNGQRAESMCKVRAAWPGCRASGHSPTRSAKYNFNSGPRAVSESAFGVITKQELLNWLANSLKAIKLGSLAKQ
jgi:hypothetical protein